MAYHHSFLGIFTKYSTFYELCQIVGTLTDDTLCAKILAEVIRMNATECIKKISSSWSEKYRPTKLSDIAASDSIITILTNCVNRNELPNLLLYGRAGVGKGSIINVLIKNLPTDVSIRTNH